MLIMNNISPIKILSVNISEKKGTIKKPVNEIKLGPLGVEHDAHSGKWHRQVSLLGVESIEKFTRQSGRAISYGEFAENITTSGMLLYQSHPLDCFTFGETELEVTQIGKECHGDNCTIYREVGKCVMPKEGIFCRVIRHGILRAGDSGLYQPKVFKIAVITLSDRAYEGIYEDRSGKCIEEKMTEFFGLQDRKSQVSRQVIPDEKEKLLEALRESLKNKADIIITTGGTGIGERDVTPDIIKPLLDKEIPGIMELIRMKYGQEKPQALLSRSVAGVIGKTLVYTLPGSVKAVEEYFSEIQKTIFHSIYMLHGLDLH